MRRYQHSSACPAFTGEGACICQPDQGPQTLAARTFTSALRLTDAVCDAAHIAYERVLNFDAAKYPDWESLRCAAASAMRAVLVAALTPEPVTPPPSAPAETWQPIDTAPKNKLVLVALIKDDKIWRVSDAKFNGLGWYTRSGEACHWRTHWAFMPSWWPHGVPVETEPASPSAPSAGSFVDVAARVRQQIENEPDDDGRGLAVDMLDVDRLRNTFISTTKTAHEWLGDLANRLETTIREIGDLRDENRGVRQEWTRAIAEYHALQKLHAGCATALNDAKGQEASAVSRAERAEAELASIDAVLARRPALDLPTRRDNIEKAINVAARADKAEQDRDALRTVMEQIYRYALNAQGDLRFDVIARQAYDALRLTEAR